MIAAIVCADRNWGIGYNGDLLVKIPEDMQRFKELTTGETVIMGRKTYDSLPVKPLPNRENVIITRDVISGGQREKNEDGSVSYTLDWAKEILNAVKNGKYNNIFEVNDIYVIGGGQIYNALFSLCDVVYVTEVDFAFENVDTYFPNLDKMQDWWIIERGEEREYNGIKYRFSIYKRVNYEILNIHLNLATGIERIKIKFDNNEVIHNIDIKYCLHDSESVILKTFTIPALCCKKNLEKFLVNVQLFKQNNIMQYD